MSLALEINRVDQVTVITCHGRIVFGQETTDLCRTVRDRLPREPLILLNLRDVEYVDSGGLGSIVGLLLAAHRSNGRFGICEPSVRVDHLLRMTKLSTVIPVFRSQEDAVAEFRQSPVAA